MEQKLRCDYNIGKNLKKLRKKTPFSDLCTR